MTSYRTEVQNVKHEHIPLLKFTVCSNMFCVPVFVIPGLETPFRGLGLDHTEGGQR